MAAVGENLGDIFKMKVAELKKELKARGLNTSGTKTELVERLQSAGSQAPQDLISEDGNAESEILDEDEVLGGVEEGGDFDDDDLAADAVLADEPKVKQPDTASMAIKRPAPLATETSQESQPKKRVLVRPISVSLTGKENGSQEKNTTNTDAQEEKTDASDKKVIKLSAVSVKERLELRAQKFGTPLSEDAKKQARAERFGIAASATATTKTSGATTNNKVAILGPTAEVLKKRAERFGCNVSSLALKVEQSEKLKKRQERFGAAAPVIAASGGNLEEKKKLRAERFKL